MRAELTCSAFKDKHCRCKRGLEAVVISAPKNGSLELPSFLVVYLCPKHFHFKREARTTEEARGK